MFLKFDKKEIHITAVCGIEENYKPSKKIKQISSKVKKLKDKVDKFMAEVYEPSVKEIEELVIEENKKYFVDDN